MEKALWTGAISFGLIYIPVRLYKASQSEDSDFVLLHRGDHARIRNRHVSEATGKEVPVREIVRGYEYEKGKYVEIEPEDIYRANVRKTRTIDILSFVDRADVDFRYVERPYYLEPDNDANQSYALLREALKESRKVAVARFVLHTREHLALLQAEDRVIVLNQMRFSGEIRAPEGLSLPRKTEISSRELGMAVKLVDLLSGPWKPEEYHDTYTEDLERMVHQKIEGKQPEYEEEQVIFEVTDLFAKLNESLEKARAGDSHRA